MLLRSFLKPWRRLRGHTRYAADLEGKAEGQGSGHLS